MQMDMKGQVPPGYFLPNADDVEHRLGEMRRIFGQNPDSDHSKEINRLQAEFRGNRGMPGQMPRQLTNDMGASPSGGNHTPGRFRKSNLNKFRKLK